MSERGMITRTETGWSISPGVWREPKAAPSPDARLEVGRIVRVTFDFILEEAATRAEIEEMVEDGLNGQFDTASAPTLEDLGIRTDKPELMQQTLDAYVARVK